MFFFVLFKTHSFLYDGEIMKQILSFVLIGLVLTTAALAGPHYVAPDGPGPAPFLDWEHAAANIQDAVKAADRFDDTVIVSNGTYTLGGTNNRCVYISQKTGLVVQAVSTNPEDTIIVGAPDPSSGNFGADATGGIYIGYSDRITISGFTISNGYGSDGGGILGGVSANLILITNCHIVNCMASRYGGGAYGNNYPFPYTNFVISRCSFLNNTATGAVPVATANGGRGGGACWAYLTNCLVEGNYATNYGGGAYYGYLINSIVRNNSTFSSGGGQMYGEAFNCLFENNKTFEIYNYSYGGGGASACSVLSNCVFIGNTSYYGGAVSLPSNAKFINCLVASNYAYIGSALHLDYNAARTNIQIVNCTIAYNQSATGAAIREKVPLSSLNFINSIIWNNYNNSGGGGVVSNWSCGQYGGLYTFANTCTLPLPTGATTNLGGNINQDPQFVDPESNFHLAGNSPCINTGSNQPWMDGTFDRDGRHRIDGFSGIVDMGCYEYVFRGMKFTVR